MLLDSLKLNKQLVRAMTDAGYLDAKEMQVKTMSRIIGGQDLIAVGPQGCGKTTSYVLGVLMRLKFGFEEAPRALILVPDKEKVIEVLERFELLNKNKTIRTLGLYAGPALESQLNSLADGVDIVVATPDRARAIYLKLALNLNKILMFVVDDAELIVKQGLQLPVVELANSIIRCQHLVYTEVVHDKLMTMINPFMKQPAVIEVDDLVSNQAETVEQILYQVPNFRTKINLLNLLLEDEELFTKVVIIVNTRLTAENLYKDLQHKFKDQVAILNPIFFESTGVETYDDFLVDEDIRILLVANEINRNLTLSHVPFLIHFDLPDEKETFINRIVQSSHISNEQPFAITFATDIELIMVKKIEQAIGQKIPVSEMPAELLIETEVKKTNKSKAVKSPEITGGGAFHEKKESNSKDYNFGSGYKAKLTNKKKHS